VTGAPRITPLPREQWDEAVEAALRAGFGDAVGDRFLSDGPDAMRVPNALTTVVRHPKLAGPFLAYNGVLLLDGVLAPRVRELVVLRVAWRTRSVYEWVQHARLAPRYDITPAEVEAIADGAIGENWTPLEADLLAATDQLIDNFTIDDATWARLAVHLDDASLIELVYVVGTYVCLAMAFNSLGIELDPDLDPSIAPPLPADEGATT
jgi:4-carboxymuconolactone decarboxylase